MASCTLFTQIEAECNAAPDECDEAAKTDAFQIVSESWSLLPKSGMAKKDLPRNAKGS